MVPDAVLVLLVRAAVVDHNVRNRHQASVLQRRRQLLELRLVAIEALQLVQLPGQVALRTILLFRLFPRLLQSHVCAV